MNTYRAISARGKAIHGEAPFEAEFTPAEEQDQLASGHIEIVPRTYRQLSVNFSAATQGETFEAALPAEVEQMLVAGGHIERVDPDDPPAGNASRDEWAKYATAHGASEEDLLGEDGKPLGRDELRDRYGATDPHDNEGNEG